VIQQANIKNDESDVEIQYFKDDFKGLGGYLLVEMFFNLIENSVKHSGCDLMKLSAKPNDTDLIIIFEDNRKGIPDEKKDDIFEKG